MNDLQTSPADVSGEASRKPALQAQPAVLRGTITVVRAATGKVETYHFTGTPAEENGTAEKE